MHECWEKEENKHKLPSNNKPKSNSCSGLQSNVTVEDNSGCAELLLTCLDLPCDEFNNCSVYFDVKEDRPLDVYFDDDVVNAVEEVVIEQVSCLNSEKMM